MTRASLLRSGGIVTLGILLGRIAGFVRDLLIAHFLGGGEAADLAIFTLTFPDVFTNLLVGGAVGAALIPEFQRLLQESPGRARALFLRSTVLSLAVFGAIALGAAVAAGGMVRLLAPGFGPEAAASASRLISLSAIAIPLTAAAAVSTAWLHSHHRFGLASVGTLLFNSVLVGLLASVVRPETLHWLAIGAGAAAALRWFSQLAGAPKIPGEPAGGSFNRELAARYVQAIGATGLLLLVPVAARAFASDAGPGAFAAMNYAFRICDLPLGMLLTVPSVVLLPRFSGLFAEGREDELRELARRAIWLTWIVSVPVALAGGWFREPLVALLFGHGRMTPATLRSVSELTVWTMATLPAQALAPLLFALLSARKDTRSALVAGLAAVLLYLPAAWMGRERMGTAGIMAATLALHWGICIAYLAVLAAGHRMRLLGDGLGRDALLGAVVTAACVAPGALLASQRLGLLANVAVAAASAGAALAAGLALPRSRVAMKAFS